MPNPRTIFAQAEPLMGCGAKKPYDRAPITFATSLNKQSSWSVLSSTFSCPNTTWLDWCFTVQQREPRIRFGRLPFFRLAPNVNKIYNFGVSTTYQTSFI
ncbi:hypothetical protein AVEN_219424-1 [Araneus ventricosus]|uniref:Uncharacterized protein n=1 Tax=Araneus ventricosus TaxID=182803 RepID=A0A4Y2P8T8_ARAVE|nr:hypothetical protein AVEN_219424-1 [Araneus ventricosus]